ncbi:hypothetical protein B0H11DRAFT_284953 [Mycena galericulata]|nr:hypothetical protein B0H11DRAFT_2203782 [Mycena galericulata]KAJ7506383.1 hypothetical protein B0H11DRAFT_284953 [Mycena galericulata]
MLHIDTASRPSFPCIDMGTRNRLKRGAACLNCRFLKIKCDGRTPCNRCRGRSNDGCEYQHGSQVPSTKTQDQRVPRASRTKALQDTIARLEARLRELEHPEDSASVVTLCYPYLQSVPPALFIPSSPSQDPDDTFTPTAKVIEMRLLEAFFAHGSEFGLFLKLGSASQLHLSSSLLNALYMWGAHLLSDPREDQFQHMALEYTSISTDIVRYFMQTIQAEVLLAYYFFHRGRFLQARTHTATAVALAIGGGLHQIRSLQHPEIPVVILGAKNAQSVRLREPIDAIEEDERINGFWAVFTLHNNLSAALGPDSNWALQADDAMRIDTPWPKEGHEYQQQIASIAGDSTIRKYLNHQGTICQEDSMVTTHLKACILYQRSAEIHKRWLSSLPQQADSFSADFQSVAWHVDSLRAQIAMSEDVRMPVRQILLTRSLLNGATIKLYSICMGSNAKEICLTAARDMFRFPTTDIRGLGYLTPMIPILWGIACSVLVEEINHIRSASSTDCPSKVPWETEMEIYSRLQEATAALGIFADDSPLMRYELNKVQEAMRTLWI